MFRFKDRQWEAGKVMKRGFTLIELLVVISIISMIAAICLPTFNHIRKQARDLLSMNNQKTITSTINIFANDNDDRYPESVATIGQSDNWNWTDPTRLIGNRNRTPQTHRAMSEYLGRYITDASIMFCPSAPQTYKYLQQSWNAGDDWDNPETEYPADPVGGTYCFYWNYRGVIEGRRSNFRGPINPAGNRSYSKLLVSDYFGYDHWRTPGYFGSCESFEGDKRISETLLLSSYWADEGELENLPEITLKAGYSDGHVETYSSHDVMPMKVSITADGTTPYPDGVGPGIFFIPRDALR